MKLKTFIDIYFVYFVNLVKLGMLKACCVEFPPFWLRGVNSVTPKKESNTRSNHFYFAIKIKNNLTLDELIN